MKAEYPHRALYGPPPSQVPRPNRGQTDTHGFVVPKPAAAPPMAAGYGRSRVDIGRCEAQGGAPRPPPRPTGPRGPLGPCPARLVPHRRPQHPRLDPRQRPRLAALMEAGGVREQPWCISSGGRPTQSPGSCSWVVWGAWGCSGQLQGRFMAVLSQLPLECPAWAWLGS